MCAVRRAKAEKFNFELGFLADTVDKNQNYQVCNIIELYILAAIYGFVLVWALPILGRPNFAMCVQTCIFVHSNTHC